MAAIQTGNAIYAAYFSSQTRLVSGPCLAGLYGAQVSLLIFAVVVIWSVTLAVKSFKMAKWHEGLKPLGVVALSSTVAMFIGFDVALRCIP